MRNVLIVENNTSSLKLNESNDSSKYVLGGTFTEFDVRNRNDRVYSAEKFLPCLEELKQRMNTLGAVFGEFDHPDVFDTSLQRASHVIKSVDYVQEKNAVEGQIQLLSTYWGKEARAIINDGLPIFVSSRAAGVTEGNGQVALKKLFTYDIVADPGFDKAKMQSINESVGFANDAQTNFRIYEMNNEEKINELFNMNKNDLITKKQLGEYSRHLVDEIKTTKNKLNEAIKVGKLDNQKVEQLVEYYENLQEDHKKLIGYLDYLAESLQVVVNENKELKSTQEKLIEHNDYLAENLEKTIEYSEYIAENVDKNIAYSEYIAENVDKNIAYSEYIAENVDKNIAYSEYIAENVDKNIAYSEYIAEHVDDNIAYSEYIAEHVDKSIDYADYIAEELDKSVTYQGLIAEKMNQNMKDGKIFENFEEGDERELPSPEDAGFEPVEDEFEEDFEDDQDGEFESEFEGEFEGEIRDGKVRGEITGEFTEGEEDIDPETDLEDELESELDSDEELEGDLDGPLEDDIEGNITENKDDDCLDCNEDEEDDDTDLDEKIDKLIEEAKKRKASETNEHHFLNFLNKSQVDSFYSLDSDEQEKVIAHINENGNYYDSKDVLRLMQEALSIKQESLEEKLIRLMPDEVKPKWEKLEESKKASVLSQARLYPELTTEDQVEHFWFTRNIKLKETTKKLLNENKFIQEDSLSEDAMNGILERFKNL